MLCQEYDRERFYGFLQTHGKSPDKKDTCCANEPAVPSGGAEGGKQAVEMKLCMKDEQHPCVDRQLDRTLTINELLCIVNNSIDNTPIATLKTVVIEFYREEEIVSAKQILLQYCDLKSRKRPKNRRQGTVVGGNITSVNFQGVAKKTVFCVNRLAVDVTATVVSDFLQSKDISVVSCYDVSRDSDQPRRLIQTDCVYMHQMQRQYAPRIYGHSGW